MLITRETDYALRILRTLSDGKSYTAGELGEKAFLRSSHIRFLRNWKKQGSYR